MERGHVRCGSKQAITQHAQHDHRLNRQFEQDDKRKEFQYELQRVAIERSRQQPLQRSPGDIGGDAIRQE